jgi:RNA polymerase sigma factor (sigma-70 family)
MAKSQERVLGQIRCLFESGATAGLTDADLLGRFNDRDGTTAESSFAILVERHGPMVLRVCRRILLDPNDADDAFQATFLILARKASVLRVVDSLGPWLHGVAFRVAMTVRSNEARRRIKEKIAVEVLRGSVTNPIDQEIGATVVEEIERLPGPYRTAVVLCLLEGLTQEQAAERLGWPPGTVRSRLARGRERLQGRLMRRGLAPAAALLTVSTTSEALAASMLKSVAVASVLWRAGSPLTEVVSASVVALSTQVLRSVLMSRIKVVAVLLVASCVGVAGICAFAYQFGTFSPTPNQRGEGFKVEARLAPLKYMTKENVTSDDMAAQLNKNAADGWEFVQAVPSSLRTASGGITLYTLIFRESAATLRTPDVEIIKPNNAARP